MATLKQYLKNLQEDYKPQPSLIDEDTEQKAEAYTETDIPIEGEGDLTVSDALEMLSEMGVDVND